MSTEMSKNIETMSQNAKACTNYVEIRKEYRRLLKRSTKEDVVLSIVNLLTHGVQHTVKCLHGVRDMACFIFLGDTGVLQHCIRTSQIDVLLMGMRVLKGLMTPEDLQDALQNSMLWSVLCRKQINRGIIWMLNCDVVPHLENVAKMTLRCIRTWCIINDKHIDILCADQTFANDKDLHILNDFTKGLFGAKQAIENENNEDILNKYIHEDTSHVDIEDVYERYRDFLAHVALHSIMPLLGGKRKRNVN